VVALEFLLPSQLEPVVVLQVQAQEPRLVVPLLLPQEELILHQKLQLL